MSAATPLLVADVLDISAQHQNRRGSHYKFIAVLMSHVTGNEGEFSEDRTRKLYSKQGKKSTLTAIRDHIVKTHGGLASGPYKTFAKLPFHAVAQWRECGDPPSESHWRECGAVHSRHSPKGDEEESGLPAGSTVGDR
jgi:hypothetical protein